MADLVIQQVTPQGKTITAVAASAGGDTIANTGDVMLQVTNGDAAQITVTATGQSKCSQGFLHDEAINVAAGATVIIGPFDPKRFNNENAKVEIGYSAVTNVTVAAIRL